MEINGEHYKKHPSGVECIDIVKYENFNIGNAIKYIWRREHKGHADEDLIKAIFYLELERDRLKKEERDAEHEARELSGEMRQVRHSGPCNFGFKRENVVVDTSTSDEDSVYKKDVTWAAIEREEKEAEEEAEKERVVEEERLRCYSPREVVEYPVMPHHVFDTVEMVFGGDEEEKEVEYPVVPHPVFEKVEKEMDVKIQAQHEAIRAGLDSARVRTLGVDAIPKKEYGQTVNGDYSSKKWKGICFTK